MKRLAIGAGLVTLVALALPAQAPAGVDVGGVFANHGREGGRHDREDGRGPAFRYGYDRGWREGSEEGHGDARRRRDPRYWREDEFRDADRGYKGWMGPRWHYSAGFREGYAAGYRRAFSAARPDWRGRWERYGWRDRREDDRYRERDRDEDWRR
jgi:hypothetical protein